MEVSRCAGMYSNAMLVDLIKLELCKLEGIIPAIESSHAFAIFDKKTFKPHDIIVMSLSGRGDKVLDTYINHFGL